MREFFTIAALFLGALSAQAQEPVMNILKTDGTHAQTRVAELQQISFLAVDAGSQGLLVKTKGDETIKVLFESNPVVTISDGKLNIKSSSAETIEMEITDIAEIVFGDASDDSSIAKPKGFVCVMQDGCVLLRGIPEGVQPRVYSLDGRSLPTPPLQGDELRLNRKTLGTGFFIVKVGTFATKIRL